MIFESGLATSPRQSKLFADKADVAFASHHWPTKGSHQIGPEAKPTAPS